MRDLPSPLETFLLLLLANLHQGGFACYLATGRYLYGHPLRRPQ